ncbi:MAG: hypothetical protein GF411_01435 [Candidatus Lokiarchaeota archaeon]|nr:hypothetical protein [Candidatus Lokiarchaeota archaeon]
MGIKRHLKKMNDLREKQKECLEKQEKRFKNLFDDLFMTDNYIALEIMQEHLYLHPFKEKALEELRVLVRGYGKNYHVIPIVSEGKLYVTFARPPYPPPER